MPPINFTHPIFVSVAMLTFGWFAVPAIQNVFADVEESRQATQLQPIWQKTIELRISENTKMATESRVLIAELAKLTDRNSWQIQDIEKTLATLTKIEREVTRLRIDSAKLTEIISSRLPPRDSN